ncbi:Peroxisomal targeting signal receptor [Elsinoe australis]|uniref:Peroxisomal targeting signal receptor n=1 Tax=Elsinoe australis TaxID=40998 RepID=A0A2P7ZYW7_9PEZI|nr:Peroxisomal targeting signal receptor [Elsinoe australis]
MAYPEGFSASSDQTNIITNHLVYRILTNLKAYRPTPAIKRHLLSALYALLQEYQKMISATKATAATVVTTGPAFALSAQEQHDLSLASQLQSAHTAGSIESLRVQVKVTASDVLHEVNLSVDGARAIVAGLQAVIEHVVLHWHEPGRRRPGPMSDIERMVWEGQFDDKKKQPETKRQSHGTSGLETGMTGMVLKHGDKGSNPLIVVDEVDPRAMPTAIPIQAFAYQAYQQRHIGGMCPLPRGKPKSLLPSDQFLDTNRGMRYGYMGYIVVQAMERDDFGGMVKI